MINKSIGYFNVFQILSILALAFTLYVFTTLPFITVIGACFSLYILNKLLSEINHTLPIDTLLIFIASLQWVVGAIFTYHYSSDGFIFYGMSIPEDEYMHLVVPGIIFFYLGVMMPIVKLRNLPAQVLTTSDNFFETRKKAAYILTIVGFFCSLTSSLVPASLGFFFYLLGNLKFVGVFYLYLTKNINKTLIWAAFATLTLEAIITSIFHDLILWITFYLFIYAIKNPVNTLVKYGLVVFGLILILLLQSVKYEYRRVIATTDLNSSDLTGRFSTIVYKRIVDPAILLEPKLITATMERLNQGWIISRVMGYTPLIQPFAEGETIENALNAALLPRVFAEEKAVAGGREKMEKFTGIKLQYGTSMNISLIGEGYVNYGVQGAIVFMFFIGAVYSLFLRYIYKNSVSNPGLIIWIPFLFLQVVKAETDLTTTFNHLVKATFVMFFVFYSFRNFLKIKL